MEKKAKLFIYDRKEVSVLFLLGALVAVFAFTLGVHLGKRVTNKTEGTAEVDHRPVPTQHDVEPTRQEVGEQVKGASEAADDVANKTLHDEVQRMGLKVDTAQPTELPEKKVHESNPVEHKNEHTETAPKSDHATKGHYSLQVGSFKTDTEVREVKQKLEAFGLEPIIKTVDLGAKGTWRRLFVGDFGTKEEAHQMGERYKGRKIISSFVVANSAE